MDSDTVGKGGAIAMKAYGLAQRMQYDLGIRTHVTTEGSDPEAEANQIRIKSSLDARQLQRLNELVEENGWELVYGSGWVLAAVPDPEFSDGEASAPEVPDIPDLPTG